MITYLEKTHTSLFHKIFCSFIALTFLSSVVLSPTPVFAQTVLNLPVPGTMIPPSVGFAPALMTGITIHPDNPLRFDFIMDRGQSGLAGEPLKEEYKKMIKYFMASLTVPEDELWVNLSPYEKDHMIPQGLGDTEMGRDMLAQDYLLKQLTASLMYPEKELGKEFWNRIYKKAYEQYGTTEIPVNTFNKVWIVPDEALVYEQGTSAFVIKSRLAVMLEEDYKTMGHNVTRSQSHNDVAGDVVTGDIVTTGIIREIIIPEIEKEINEGETFASLRQIYNALILATWYKQRLKDSLLGKVYVDQNKTKGIDTQDKEVNQKIYDQYIESFKKGVYNFIKEDYDPATQQVIPRKYFSGGARLTYHPRKGSLILKTVGSLFVGALLAFGSPAPVNAQDSVAAATQGNKDGVTTEFVDNAKQGDIGTAVTVREGVQPILLAQATKDKEKLKGPTSSLETDKTVTAGGEEYESTLNLPDATVRIEGAPVDPAGVKFEGDVYIYNNSGQLIKLSEQAGRFFPKTPEGNPLVKDTVIVIKPSADAATAASPIVGSPTTRKLTNVVLALATAGMICLSGCGGPGSTTPPPEISIEVPISVRDVLSWERSQQDSRTGLVESYDNTTDSILWNQASTYDQALAVITNMLGGDIESARKIMDFFVQNRDSTHGFVNFYVTSTGLPGIQKALAKHQGSRVHSGPNLWIGIAAVALYEVTGDIRYLNLAVDAAKWIATVVPHDANGGIAMGPEDDAAPWTKIYSTEHNLDYAAILQKLLAKQDKLTTAEKDLFEAERTGVKRWIKARYNSRTGILDRGLNDATKALDSTTLFILTFGPQTIQNEFGIDPDQLIAKAEEYFGVTVTIPGIQGTVSGFDFTDPDFRGPVIWFEGTGQMTAVYEVVAKWHETLGNDKMAANYRAQKDFYKTQIDKVKREYPDGREAVPYASERVKTFSDGWYTPSNGPDGKLAVSVSGSSWRVISDGTYNPMAAKGEESSSPVGDYYEVLGVARDAALEEIKTAYRELAKKLHPDINMQIHPQMRKSLEEQFKEINLAYEILSDLEKRGDYDFILNDGTDHSNLTGQQGTTFDIASRPSNDLRGKDMFERARRVERMREPEYIPILVDAFNNDTDMIVRASAGESLARIGTREALFALTKLDIHSGSYPVVMMVNHLFSSANERKNYLAVHYLVDYAAKNSVALLSIIKNKSHDARNALTKSTDLSPRSAGIIYETIKGVLTHLGETEDVGPRGIKKNNPEVVRITRQVLKRSLFNSDGSVNELIAEVLKALEPEDYDNILEYYRQRLKNPADGIIRLSDAANLKRLTEPGRGGISSSPVSGQRRLIGAITALSLLWGTIVPSASALEMSLWKKFDEPTERARMINEIALGIINLGDERTGLAPSHFGHPGFEKLKFVYDAAVDALVLKAAGKQKEAEKILDYFADRLAIPIEKVAPYADTNGIAGILKVWKTDEFNVRGLINALDRTSTKPRGQGMLEYYSTPGPMAFVVMAFLNVNKERYLPVAVELGKALLSLQRPDGGLKDGDRSPNRVHIEPHMDSFATFLQLYQATNDKKWKTAAEKAWQFFVKSDAYHPQEGIIWQGVWEFGTNKVFATDAYSWTMAGPGGDRMSLYELEKFTETMLAKSLTRVTLEVPDGKTKSVILVDFTDPQNPQVVKERGGFHPMGSVEWVGGVIVALQKNAVRFWEKGNPQQKEKARHYKALAEYLIANSLYAFYEIPGLEGMLSFYATGQNVETGHGWRTPFFYVKGPGVTIKGGSLVSAWPVLPIQGLNPFDRQDPYKKFYDAIPISGKDKEQALQFVALSVVNRSFKEAVPTKGPDAATQIVEPGNYNLQMWNAFVRGDYKKSIEWAQKVVNDPDWIRLARRDQEQKAKEIGGLVRYPWGNAPSTVPNLEAAIWRYPLLNEVAAAMWGLAAANFELGNREESKKWIRRIIEEVSYHQIYAPDGPGYWNALISWEFNPGNVRRDAQMGVLYREVLRGMGLRSAAPKEISIRELKFAPPSTLDTQGKPQTQEAPSRSIPGPESQKGKDAEDVQIDKEVMSYLEQINIVDPGAAKRSRPFQAIVKIGQRAEATLVRVIQNHELGGDPLKWAAYLLGVVGSYDVAKPVLESVVESSSYPWYVQVEARNGLDVLEERFQKQEPKKKPSKGDVGIEQTVLSYLKQLTIPDPTAAKNSRAFREIVALGKKAESTLVKVIQNRELEGDPLKWAAFLLGVVGSYDVAKPVLERVIQDSSYPWYVREEAKNGLQILLRRKAAGQAGLKEDDSKILAFVEVVTPSAPVSSPAVERATSEGYPVGFAQGKRDTSDEIRTTKKVGGIDLNPALLDLQIKRDGNGVPLPLPMQPIENMHIDGFLPVIINIVPITNLPLLLGLDLPPAQDERPVRLTYQELSLVLPPAKQRFFARESEEAFA